MVSQTTAPSVTTFSSTNSSKPKLAFSIDSIVGRNSSSHTTSDCNSDSERHSPRLSAQHKSRHSPVSCVRSVFPLISNHRLCDRWPQMGRQLSPSNGSAANMSPLSTPSPLHMANGSASSPYLDQIVASHPSAQQSHSTHPGIGQHSSQQFQHQMMMASHAQHISSLPQPYHQDVALYPWLMRANPFANRFHGI